MRISYIREFLAVADSCSFSSTSKRLFITQSVLSRHIAALENELGAKLFVRNSHNLQLTKEGELFYEDAPIIVKTYDSSIEKLAQLKTANGTSLHIGYLYGSSRELLPCIRDWLSSQGGNILPRLFSMEYGELISALQKRDIDVAIVTDIDPWLDSSCDKVKLYEDSYMAAFSTSHRFSGKRTISLEDFTRENIIVPDKSVMEAPFNKFRMILGHSVDDATQFYRDTATLHMSISMGEGISLLPTHHKSWTPESIGFAAIEDALNTRFSICAYWLKDTSLEKSTLYRQLFENVHESYHLQQTIGGSIFTNPDNVL